MQRPILHNFSVFFINSQLRFLRRTYSAATIMFGVRQLFLLVFLWKFIAIFAGNFTVSVEWYPEKFRTYSFNRNIFGECILSLQEDMVRCMRNHRFQEIEDQWRYNPKNVTYLAVNCLKQVRIIIFLISCFLYTKFYKLYHFDFFKLGL